LPAPTTPGEPVPVPVPTSGEVWSSAWRAAAPSPTPRFEPAAITLGGTIYVFGGFTDGDYEVSRTYDAYDVAADRWTTLGTLPAGMAETHLGIATDGEAIYLAGGFGGAIQRGQRPPQWISDAVWRFRPSDGSWTMIA